VWQAAGLRRAGTSAAGWRPPDGPRRVIDSYPLTARHWRQAARHRLSSRRLPCRLGPNDALIRTTTSSGWPAGRRPGPRRPGPPASAGPAALTEYYMYFGAKSQQCSFFPHPQMTGNLTAFPDRHRSYELLPLKASAAQCCMPFLLTTTSVRPKTMWTSPPPFPDISSGHMPCSPPGGRGGGGERRGIAGTAVRLHMKRGVAGTAVRLHMRGSRHSG